MKPLIPQTVYVVQDVNKKLPSNGIVHTLERGESCNAAVYSENGGFWVEHCKPELITHWLEKKENQYIFTKEELIELLNNTWDNSRTSVYSNSYVDGGVSVFEEQVDFEKTRFINNLLKQQ